MHLGRPADEIMHHTPVLVQIFIPDGRAGYNFVAQFWLANEVAPEL